MDLKLKTILNESILVGRLTITHKDEDEREPRLARLGEKNKKKQQTGAQ